MITLYGKKYARTESEFTGSLFHNDGQTCNGFYRVNKAGIYIFDHRWKPVAFIRCDGFGPVSVTRVNNQWRYMHALDSNSEKWMSVPDSYIDEREGAKQLTRAVYND